MKTVNGSRVKIGMVVAFENDGSFVGNRIVAYQEWLGFKPPASNITHVAISMGGDYLVDATFPKSKVSRISQDYQGRKAEYLYLRDDSFRDRLRYKFTLWGATQINLDYGWMALLGFYINAIIPILGDNILHSKRDPFCSYLVAWAFRRVGYDLWPGTASELVTPAHIRANKDLEVIDVSIPGCL